jgi:type III secretory pathway component EscR
MRLFHTLACGLLMTAVAVPPVQAQYEYCDPYGNCMSERQYNEYRQELQQQQQEHQQEYMQQLQQQQQEQQQEYMQRLQQQQQEQQQEYCQLTGRC